MTEQPWLRVDQSRADHFGVAYSWEGCLMDISLMAERLRDFQGVDETFDFYGCQYLFEPE